MWIPSQIEKEPRYISWNLDLKQTKMPRNSTIKTRKARKCIKNWTLNFKRSDDSV